MAFSVVNPLLYIGSSTELRKDVELCKSQFFRNNPRLPQRNPENSYDPSTRSEVYAVEMTMDRRTSNLNSQHLSI